MRACFKLLLILAAIGSMAHAPAPLAQSKTIGVALASDTNPFYIAMLKGMRARAKVLGYELSVVNAEEEIVKQLNGLNDLVARKVAGILVSPVDAKALCSAYDNAVKAGIPIISIARSAACETQLHHVAINEYAIGRDVARWTSKALGGKGAVAMLEGPAGAESFQNFARGYDEEMKRHPGIKIVFRQSMLLTRENGIKYAEDALVAHPGLEAIYGANDEIALGAAQAVAATGKIGKILVTGVNGIPPALLAVKRGRMALTVAVNPVRWGNLGIDIMHRHLSGRRIDRKVYVDYTLIDKSNVDAVLDGIRKSTNEE